MLADTTKNTRKYISLYQNIEKSSRAQNDSIIKRRKVNNFPSMGSSQTNQKLEVKRTAIKQGIYPVITNLPQIETFQQFSSNNNKINTPSHSFHFFDPSKIITSNITKNQRPISVGGKNTRPAFLEPEVTLGHYSNKSAIIASNIIFKETEEYKEPYKFPLYRTKKISEFRLSISPEPLDSENSHIYPKTPSYKTKGSLKINKTQRVPMSIVSKIPGKNLESYLTSTKTQNFNYKNSYI